MTNILDSLGIFRGKVVGMLGWPDFSISYVDVIEVFLISFFIYHIVLWV